MGTSKTSVYPRLNEVLGMNKEYEQGVLQALVDSGLIKTAGAGSIIAAALAGKLVGGGLGAAYPQALGLDKDKRLLGGALGALLGGGVGLGAHAVHSHFKTLAEIGRPIVQKSRDEALQKWNDIAEEARRLSKELGID